MAADRLSLLQTFVASVEAGSLSGAARRLDRSLSVVSRELSALEKQLGARLIDRSPRRLSPTPAGEALLPGARRLVALAGEVLGGGPAAEGATVRISTTTAFGLRRIAPTLAALDREHPGVVVELRLENQVVSLERDGVDVVVRTGFVTLPDSLDLVARSLGDFGLTLVASPRFVARHGQPRSPQELSRLPFVAHSSLRARTVLPFQRGERTEAVSPSVRLWTNDILLALATALEGVGLTVVPDWLAAPEVAQGRLVVVLPGWSLPRVAAWVAYRRHGRGQAAVRAVVTHLARHVGFDRR